MATLLQDILGVPVEVVNVEGGSGVNGVEYTYKQPADGYTFMLGTQSLYIQDMLGNTSMDFKTEFECEDVLVHSINAIVASKISMEKFGVSNWAELQAYIKDHPFEVSVAMLTATGVDGASLAQATEGLDLLEIPYSFRFRRELRRWLAATAICMSAAGMTSPVWLSPVTSCRFWRCARTA